MGFWRVTCAAPVPEDIEGIVVEEGGRFFLRLPSTEGGGKLEAHLVSEGFRKLAMIIRFVSNGVLLQGGHLFWDEPEANLNPSAQRAVAKVIVELARSGTQVFVAAHSPVDGSIFTFEDGRAVEKVDEWPECRRFSPGPMPARACDLVVMGSREPWLVEAKDHTYPGSRPSAPGRVLVTRPRAHMPSGPPVPLNPPPQVPMAR